MTLRQWAVVLSAGAILFPLGGIVTGYYTPEPVGGSQPGLEAVRPIAVTIMVSGLLSITGFIAGLVSFLRQPPPRARARKLECLATSFPLLLYTLLTTAFYIVWTS